MKIKKIKYYLKGISNIICHTNFYIIPSIFFKKPILIKIKNNLSFYVTNLMDIWTLNEVLIDQEYFQYKSIKKNDVVVDIGASIGDFSIYAEKKGAKRIISYEMDKERIDLFNKNIKINRCKKIVIKNSKACSLNEVFRENNLQQCDFLKMDCEGCEYELFSNASKQTLKKISFIAMETHQFDDKMKKKYRKLINLLKKNKFHIIEKENSVHSYISYLFAGKK